MVVQRKSTLLLEQFKAAENHSGPTIPLPVALFSPNLCRSGRSRDEDNSIAKETKETRDIQDYCPH